MKYSDVNLDNEFIGNMRDTPWASFFPRWFMEDDFIKSIGKEIEYIKSKSIFKLLNVGVKPPVLLWQESLVHKKYTITKTINSLKDDGLNNKIKTKAPLYKTWGTIKITNYGDELNNLQLFVTEKDGISINEFIDKNDTIFIDIENQKFYLNDVEIDVVKYGEGFPYFITTRNNEVYKQNTPLHNETLLITFLSNNNVEDVQLQTETILNNVVFENEQNIDITSLELLPLKKVVLYAEYDFPHNKQYNGIKKVYEKKYDPETNVVADMITTRFFTKKFYVEVYFKDVEHPYVVGFPCYKDADLDSAYHINTELDTLGDILELQRRNYKTNIPEEDYPFTFPEYYPFDIEQDYWYYQRLVNEYAWNDNAIDRVDVKDTEDNTVMRLHSINPFVEDFVVYANSTYPEDIEGINYNEYLPSFIYQDVDDNRNVQSPFYDTQNLLRKNDDFSYVTLHSKSDNFISYEGYKSKELGLYFDLSDIPENVNIDGFEIIIDTESTDNSTEKYNDNRTRLQIANDTTLPNSIETSGYYELKRKNIIYGGKDSLFGLDKIPQTNNYIEQKIYISKFQAKSGAPFKIPFEYYEDYDLDTEIDEDGHEIITDRIDKIDDDDVQIDDLNNAMIFFYNSDDECVGTTQATYHSDIIGKTRKRYLLADFFPYEKITKMNIISTYGNKHAFNVEVKIDSEVDSEGSVQASGPSRIVGDSKLYDIKGYEKDLAYLLRNNGIYFIYALTNDSIQYNLETQRGTSSSTSVLLHNIFLRVYYSPKKEKVSLKTKVNKYIPEDDETTSTVAELIVKVTNTGEKIISTDVDIIAPENLILSDNYIEINDLDIGESITQTILIEPSKPIIDGEYDILTICGDQQRINQIRLQTDGNEYTGVIIKPQMCFIDSDTTITAKVINFNKEEINEGEVEFSVNGKRIVDKNTLGNAPVQNGIASLTFKPSDYEFISLGVNNLVAKFTGTERYTISRAGTSLYTKGNSTKITLDIPDVIVQKYETPVGIEVTYKDENGDEHLVPEGRASLFIDDEEIFTLELVNGQLSKDTTTFTAGYNVGDVTARAVYSGTDTYPSCETTQEVTIIGGKVTLNTPDIDGRPDQEVTITTYVHDKNNNKILYGYIDYTILDAEDNIINEYKNAIVYNGKCNYQYHIPADAIPIEDEEATTQFKVIADYHTNLEDEIETSSYSYINIARGEVQIIYHSEFKYSNNEPLGFYVELLDKKTGYPVTDGAITISIPTQNIIVGKHVEQMQEVNGQEIPIYSTEDNSGKNLIYDYITALEPDDEGKIRIIYNPIEFSAKQWSNLHNSQFRFRNNEKYGELIQLDAQYFKSDLWLCNAFDTESELFNFEIKNDNLIFNNIETITNAHHVYTHEGYEERIYNKGTEHERTKTVSYLNVYIKTSQDFNNFIRRYHVGTHTLTIDYNSNYQYKTQNIEVPIEITNPSINIDTHRYDLTYTDHNTDIITYVTNFGANDRDLGITDYTNYNIENDQDLNDIIEHQETPQISIINCGNVNYYIDGELVHNSNINYGEAMMPSSQFQRIPAGHHILMTEYVPGANCQNWTYTYDYTYLNMKKATSHVVGRFNRTFPGKKSKLFIKIDIDSDEFEIVGDVYVYLDDTEVAYNFLNGSEHGELILSIDMPKDLRYSDYTCKIVYSGNEYISGDEHVFTISAAQLPVIITSEDVDLQGNENARSIYITPDTDFILSFRVDAEPDDNETITITSDDVVDDISEGKIKVITTIGNESIESIGNVINNKANVKIPIPNMIGQTGTCIIQYFDAVNYKDTVADNEIILYIIDGEEIVYVDGTNDLPQHAPNLKTGLWAVKKNGKIYLSSWGINKSGLLKNTFKITKDVKIIGDITQDVVDNQTDDEDCAYNVYPYIMSDVDEIQIASGLIKHNKNEFTEEELESFQIVNIKQEQISMNDFIIIEQELYYMKEKELIHVYLFDDGLFYSTENIMIKDTVLDINGHNVTFENIRFKNNDLYNNFVIKNDGNLTISQCIIEDGVKITDIGTLKCNENLIYGVVNASSKADVDNNWWGQNTSPISTNNNIILSISTTDNPPVIGEVINIKLELIGENGKHYNLPQVPFKIYAESGNINIDSGNLVDSQIITSYDDALHEGNVFGEVDNQKVSLKIYDYEKKTEIILKTPDVAPIGYQVTLKAIVQSQADRFYKFNDKNEIVKQTTNINGHVVFYIKNDTDYNRIGKVALEKGAAILPIYLSNDIYHDGDEFEIKAVYEPADEYFSSEACKNIKFITPTASTTDEQTHYIYYVSPNASYNGDGSFASPYRTIQQVFDDDINTYQPNDDITIYLKSGEYTEDCIVITRNTKIFKYDEDVIFTNNGNTIIEVINDITVNIKDIDFKNNGAPILIRNNGNLVLENCVFYNNDTLIGNKIASASSNTCFKHCAIVDNYRIAEDYDDNKINTYRCWFGVNNPNAELNLTYDTNKTYTIDNYIIMDLEASKSIIYIGAVAHIIASLNKYVIEKNNSKTTYDYTGELPLRVALFESSLGSLTPLRDYTYNKQSISFFNTTELVNSDKIGISAEDNTNYYGDSLKLKTYIETTLGIPIEYGKAYFTVTRDNKSILSQYEVEINNGIASFESDKYKLNVGEYTLKCDYYTKDALYTANFKFKVKLPSLFISNIEIDEFDHLYNLRFDADINNSMGTKVHNIPVECYIDNRKIGWQYLIKNNHLSLDLSYPARRGNRTLRIKTINLDTYEPFDYTYHFISYDKPTAIEFSRTGLASGEQINFNEIVVKDDLGKLIDRGKVSVSINGENIGSQSIYNGSPQEFEKITLQDGVYSIVISYEDSSQLYRSSVKIINNFNVGIYPISLVGIPEIFEIEYGQELAMNFRVVDNFGAPVDRGYFEFYIDDIKLSQEDQIKIHNSYLECTLNTQQLLMGTHDFEIKYYDETHVYADTTFNARLIVTPIKTEIVVQTINATPNTTVEVDYDVISEYHTVNCGILKAFLNDKEIGRANVTNARKKKISLAIPYEIGTKTVEFKYTDDENGYFSPDSIDVALNINYGLTNIYAEPSIQYPNENFTLSINITDIEDKPIDKGEISIYIDGVLEYSEQPVRFGTVEVPMSLQQVKNYEILIEYHQNEYYRRNTLRHHINTNKIDIIDIKFDRELKAEVGGSKTFGLIFDTFNEHEVADGVVDFIFDGNLINTYYVQENNKEFKLDFPVTHQGNDHTLKVKYYDSDVFNDSPADDNVFDFKITPHIVTMTVPNSITAELSNTVEIPVTLDENVTGLLKYYITDDNGNEQLIDIQSINNSKNVIGSYIIPNTVRDDRYNIRIEFTDNNQYCAYDVITTLYITPTDPVIEITEIKRIKDSEDEPVDIDSENPIYDSGAIFYKDKIEITATMKNQNGNDIQGQELIYFYINEDEIGHATIKDVIKENENVREATLTYILSSKYIAGTYNITARYLGSKVINAGQSDPITQRITSYLPYLVKSSYEIYSQNKLTLDGIVKGNRDLLLSDRDGNLKYIDTKYDISENSIIETKIGEKYSFYPLTNESYEITAQIESFDETKYLSRTQNIPVEVNPNPLTFEIAPIELDKHRGEEVIIKIIGKCNTIAQGVKMEIPIKVNGETGENIVLRQDKDVNNNSIYGQASLEYTYIIPMSGTPSITVELINHNIYTAEPIEENVPYTERYNIYVNKNVNTSGDGATQNTPVKTIAEALELVHSNGNIYLLSNINEENIEINKVVSIIGQNENKEPTERIISKPITIKSKCNLSYIKFENANVTSEGAFTINNCKFDNSKLILKDTFNIENSKFYNASEGAIHIENKNKAGTIKYCEIYDNTGINGAGIYAAKGDDLIIDHNTFYNNNVTSHGAALYLNGDSLVRYNSFFENGTKEDIYVIAGVIESEFNVFDNYNHKKNIVNYAGYITANMTYWGINDIDEIDGPVSDLEQHRLYDAGNGNVIIESWLLSDYHINPEISEEIQDYIIVPRINKYHAHRIDSEDISIIDDPIEWKFPAYIEEEQYWINKFDDIENNTIQYGDTITIGRESFEIIKEKPSIEVPQNG